MRARAFRDVFLGAILVASGCAVQPARSYYDDLDASDAAPMKMRGGGDASAPDDATAASDDGPVVMEDATGDVTADVAADVTADAVMESGPMAEAGEAAAPRDSGPDAPAEAEAAVDSGPDAPVEAGCGPVNTATNCGACGVACGNLHVMPSGASCVSSQCQYNCAAGYSNCTQTGANTTGCECHTPTCCPSGCETTHATGIPSLSYYDCSPLATSGMSQQTLLDQALEACAAYTGNVAQCASDLVCSRGSIGPYVCNGMGSTANCTTCWSYGGTDVLKTESCTCPTGSAQPTIIGTWN